MNEWEDMYKKGEWPWETFKPEKHLADLFKKNKIPKGKALDMGCGLGTHAIFLAKQEMNVKAFDLSEKAIEIARERAEKEKVKVDFFVQDVNNVNFKENEFDFVFDRGLFHHLNSKEKKHYLEKLVFFLKKNGKYQLIAFSSKNTGFEKALSEKEVKEFFKKHFKVLEVKEVIHVEPQGSKVFLNSYFMEKTN